MNIFFFADNFIFSILAINRISKKTSSTNIHTDRRRLNRSTNTQTTQKTFTQIKVSFFSTKTKMTFHIQQKDVWTLKQLNCFFILSRKIGKQAATRYGTKSTKIFYRLILDHSFLVDSLQAGTMKVGWRLLIFQVRVFLEDWGTRIFALAATRWLNGWRVFFYVVINFLW